MKNQLNNHYPPCHCIKPRKRENERKTKIVENGTRRHSFGYTGGWCWVPTRKPLKDPTKRIEIHANQPAEIKSDKCMVASEHRIFLTVGGGQSPKWNPLRSCLIIAGLFGSFKYITDWAS
ncbi:hypothetical protein GOBAR_DD30854 [Gossypium barbadense]|nr:hypothetical protein GOBAR_DD30854 [Gossypium barbadense]